VKNILLLLFAFCLAIVVQGQVKKKIKKGRRYKSGSDFALNKNDFQAEWEFGKETIDSQLRTIVYPNLVLHYALSDRMEVNTEISLITTNNDSYLQQKSSTGIEPVLIGANYQVLRDTYNTPSITISGQLALPFLATKKFTVNYLAPTLQADIQEELQQKWIFSISGGLLWDGFSTSPSLIYNASTSYMVKKKWMVTAECFGFISHNLPQNSFDGSIAYVFNNLVQFGISAGTGISAAASKNYFAVNGSWGLNTLRKHLAH
jgi:hypothetical protein